MSNYYTSNLLLLDMYTAMQWRAGSDLQFLKNLKYDKLLCKIFFIMLEMDELLFIKHAHHLMKPSNFVGEGTCSFRWHPMINHKWSKVFEISILTLFGWSTASHGPLSKGQLHSPELHHCVMPFFGSLEWLGTYWDLHLEPSHLITVT